MMNIKQFDLYLADLNPRFSTETGKTRPVLVIQTDLLNKVHPSTIICPVTTIIKKGVSILRVNMDANEGGIAKPSSILIDQIRAIDNKRFVKKIGTLPVHLQSKVKENIKIVLELN